MELLEVRASVAVVDHELADYFSAAEVANDEGAEKI
jgi:hypothetical protein